MPGPVDLKVTPTADHKVRIKWKHPVKEVTHTQVDYKLVCILSNESKILVNFILFLKKFISKVYKTCFQKINIVLIRIHS